MARGGASSRRPGRIAAAIGLALLAGSVGAPLSRAQEGAEPGFGQAQAVLLMIDPRSAELSFGVRFGPTVTDHRNRVARAVAQSVDYGLIGSALTGQGCSGGPPVLGPEDLPQRIRADSREPGDARERTVEEGMIVQSVLADPRPFAQATSRLVDLDLSGLLRISGATNRTTSGVDEEGRPLATGTVDVARLSLAGGLVELRGLHWEASFPDEGEPHGAFTVGAASIAGLPLPTQDASAALAAVNDVLEGLGLVLTPPRSHLDEGTLFVDPIRIGVRPHVARDRITGEVLAAIQPLREALFDAVLAAACDAGAAITVVDILVGAFTGGGSFTLNIGGTQAQLVEPEPFEGFGAPDPAGLPVGAPPSGSGGPGAPPGLGPVPGSTPSPGPARAADDLGGEPVGADAGTRSDGALAVGLVVLAFGAVLVEADRRKMRAALAPVDPTPAEVPSG